MTKVEVVTIPPAKFITTVSGIPTQERAKAWGERKGFALVQWVKKYQRAFGIEREVK